MTRPKHPNGIDRMYPVNGCCGGKSVYVDYGCQEVEECPVQMECPAKPFDVYVPVSTADCEKIDTVEIPHTNVATLSEARAFPNHYVFVEQTQQWVHIDSYGNTASLSNANLYKNNFDPMNYEGIYKNAQVYDFAQEKAFVFNPAGQYAEFPIKVKMNTVLEGE